MNNPIYLVGPTAAGKSEIAVLIAKKINAEIVSCDSMQVYKGMDVATDKPSKELQKKIPHYMIDLVEVNEGFDVSKYLEKAGKIIHDIKKREKIPFVVGGTGFYVKAMIDGLFEGPGKDEKIRNELKERINDSGLESAYKELKKIDPKACEKINPNDKKRIIRALEVYYLTGRPISSFQTEWGQKKDSVINGSVNRGQLIHLAGVPAGHLRGAMSPAPVHRSIDNIIIGLTRERADLYERIDRRVEEMFDKGIVEETRRLIDKGIMNNETASQALGYKEIKQFLDGKCGFSEAKELLKRNTRRFAKRQLTWFGKDDRVRWFMAHKDETAQEIADKIIDFLGEKGC